MAITLGYFFADLVTSVMDKNARFTTADYAHHFVSGAQYIMMLYYPFALIVPVSLQTVFP